MAKPCDIIPCFPEALSVFQRFLVRAFNTRFPFASVVAHLGTPLAKTRWIILQ